MQTSAISLIPTFATGHSNDVHAHSSDVHAHSSDVHALVLSHVGLFNIDDGLKKLEGRHQRMDKDDS